MRQIHDRDKATYKIQVVLNKVVLEHLVRQGAPGELLNEVMVRITLPRPSHIWPLQKILQKASSSGHQPAILGTRTMDVYSRRKGQVIS